MSGTEKSSMEIDAREFGELIGEIRSLRTEVSSLSKAMTHLTENYIGRPEYERRFSELIKEMHRRDEQLDRDIKQNAVNIATNKKVIDELNVTDAKGGVRDRLMDHIGATLFGGFITFIIIAITHILHLI